MRVLAIDSSGLTATVAVVEDTQTVAEYTINYKKTHSQTLLPMIDEVVKMTELDCHCGGRGTGILYWASHWICDGKRSGVCVEQTSDPCADSGRTGL